MEALSWRRFVRGAESVELARRGPTVFVRGDAGAVEVKALGSEDAAKKVLEGRARVLLRDGFVEAGEVPGEVPATRPARPQEQGRERASAEVRAAFDRKLGEFVGAWQALGFDPRLSFRKQCTRVRTHPREVAKACLELVARIFAVGFTRRTTSYDDEHGKAMGIPDRLLADFYVGPAEVLVIAYCQLRGQAGRTDDVDAPGLADELADRLRAVVEAQGSPGP